MSRKGICPGFVIAPFDLSNPIFTISDIEVCNWEEVINTVDKSYPPTTIFNFPNRSTEECEHKYLIESIQEIINDDPNCKIIASKVIIKKGKIDVKSSFLNLCSNFPDAFIFMIHTPYSGNWLGASPELLLRSADNTLYTYALAGTRPAGTKGEWDDKNIKEQRIVKDFITDTLKKFNIRPECSGTETRRAGSVEHLLTEINSSISENINVIGLLDDLSPTPALSGYPKEMAMKAIDKLEANPRGFYGGFVGPYSKNEDFCFYVNLRSVCFLTDRYCMQVGGGITALSDPKEEWIETERKAKSILSHLILKTTGLTN
ncbi:MAG: chorismate-binding protein [Muribaculaceae bacterium]|nr:chorismate-binding protein [Muribaculaceae bacterium]